LVFGFLVDLGLLHLLLYLLNFLWKTQLALPLVPSIPGTGYCEPCFAVGEDRLLAKKSLKQPRFERFRPRKWIFYPWVPYNGGRVPRVERRKQARSNPLPSRRTTATMAENWVDERDKAILETIYYCENCNMVLEPGDNDVEWHKKDLPNHKMRKVFIVRCDN